MSESDTPEKWTFAEKLAAYTELGVREFVCFDLDAAEGSRLRIWDRIEGDFVERVVERDRSPCALLTQLLGTEIEWTITPWGRYPGALRILRDGALVPTDGEYLAAERAHVDVERARADAAEARIAELEAEARRLRGA